MNDILAQQKRTPAPLTARDFLLAVCGIIVKLAICQILVNLMIAATGMGLLNVAFYLYAVVIIVRFMGKTVSGCVYTLKADTLILERRLGDSTTTMVEIPLSSIAGVCPIRKGEDLHLCYKQVTVIDDRCKPSLMMGASFFVCMISSKLAYLMGSSEAKRPAGMLIAFNEGGALRACVFMPNEAFAQALAPHLPGVYGVDERTRRPLLTGIRARSMQRAYPSLYPYVKPLNDANELAWAQRMKEEENARRQQKREMHRQEVEARKEKMQRERDEQLRKKAEKQAGKNEARAQKAGEKAKRQKNRDEKAKQKEAKLLEKQRRLDEADRKRAQGKQKDGTEK